MAASHWKKEQKKRRNKIKRQILSRGLTALFIFFVLFLGLMVWKMFKKSKWDGKHEINFVVQGEKVTIFSFNPQKKFLNILVIPKESHITAAKGYGEYKITNIYKLGELEKIGGGELLSSSIRSFFAIPIDGWIKLESLKLKETKLLPVFWLIIKRQAKTNLSWWDLGRLFWQSKNLPIDQINKVDLEKTNYIGQESLPDGSRIYKFEAGSIDDLTIRMLSDEDILQEDLQIVVLNGTSHPGLAKDMARVVKNLGAELIGVKDYELKVDQSQIFCQSKKLTLSHTALRIAKNFGMEISDKKLDDQKVDLVIVLGEDFWRRFYSSSSISSGS